MTVTLADRIRNIYRLTKAEYGHMINSTINAKYETASNNVKLRINIVGKRILRSKEVLNQLEINGASNSFKTLKDCKKI